MAEILLVNPLILQKDPVEAKLMTPYFPLGILYVAGVLREDGYDVAIFDAMFTEGEEDFLITLKREKPKVVGFSVLATVRRSALRMAAMAKEYGAVVIVGGADPTARPAFYLNYQADGQFVVDIVSVGESEAIIRELMPLLLTDKTRARNLSNIQGVAYRDPAGQVITTSRCGLIKDIDVLPYPARDLINWDLYQKAWRGKHGFFAMSIIATRGCPFNCSWCQRVVFGRSFRPRDPENVAGEFRHLKDFYKPDFIRIVDDAMGIQKDWVKKWRDAVLEKDAVIPFECLSRADLLDAEIVGWLKDAGCRRIALGAESGSQKILDLMHKGFKVEQIYQAAKLCHQAGIETYFYMMVGYPGETWEDLKLSVKMLRETQPDIFSTTIAYPLPGTTFFEQVKDRLPAGEDMSDWDYTAENRLLFQCGKFNTAFYRQVISWFHHEWEYAWLKAGKPSSFKNHLKTRLALWRNRLILFLLLQKEKMCKERE